MLANVLSIARVFQQVDVDEKLKNAPNDQYAIGVFIGEMLPFVLLIGLAYFFFYQAKKRRNKDL